MTDPRFTMLQRLDAGLTGAGFPPTTAWWLREAERFYSHPTASTWVARVGRGGIKSTTLVLLAMAETLGHPWRVPPGERHYFAFFTLAKEEGYQRLGQLEARHRALGIPFRRAGDVLELEGLPLGYRVHAAEVGAVSGFRCIGSAGDEAAKQPSAGASPFSEVLASATAMTVTHPDAHRFVFSSPMGHTGWHPEAIERGDTDGQIVSIAPTWVANPSITEQQTRALEPDQRIWSREYAAIPQADATAAFPPEEIDPAFRPLEPPLEVGAPVGIVDFSSGRSDAATWAVARWCWPQAQGGSPYLTTRERVSYRDQATGEIRRELRAFPVKINGVPQPNPSYVPPPPPFVVLEGIQGVEGAFWQSLPASELVRRMADTFLRAGVSHVVGDQRESYLLQSEFGRWGLRFIALAWDNANKQAAVERLRRWFRERTIVFPDQPPPEKLRRELYGFAEKITPSGAITYGARGAAHDDYAALCLTAAMASAEHLIPADPLAPRRRTFRLPPGIVL